MTDLPPLTDHMFYHLEWRVALVEVSDRVFEQIRYQGMVPDAKLAKEIQRIGEQSRKDGSMYKVVWPNRFTIIAFPNTGTCQFIPWNKRNYRAPFKDIAKALLVFLCGHEPIIPSSKPPDNLTRLDFTREQAVKILANFQITFIGIEREILADPNNVCPIGAEVKTNFPAKRHLPESGVRFVINGSGGRKEGETSGPPREAIFFDHVNFENLGKEKTDPVTMNPGDPGLEKGNHEDLFTLEANDLATPTMKNSANRAALGICALREEIDHNRETEAEGKKLHQEIIDRFNRQTTVLEEFKEDNKQRDHLTAVHDKDSEELLKRIPPDFASKVISLLEDQVDATRSGSADVTDQVKHQEQELVDPLNKLTGKIDELILKIGELSQIKVLGKRGPYKKPLHPQCIAIDKFLAGVHDASLQEISAQINAPEGLTSYYLKKLIALKLVEKKQGIRMTSSQPIPASPLQPKNKIDEFLSLADDAELDNVLGIRPPAKTRLKSKGKRGPKHIWLYSKSHNSSPGT